MTVKGVKSKPVVPYTVTAGAEIMICQCALLVRSCAQTLEYRSKLLFNCHDVLLGTDSTTEQESSQVSQLCCIGAFNWFKFAF